MSTHSAPTSEHPNLTAMAKGARNLLLNCVGIKPGEQVLIVREDPRLGYYDDVAPRCVEAEAQALGARVYSLHTPVIDGPDDVPALLSSAMEQVEHTIFFSRIGDQMRFYPLPGSGTKTMCYALDAGFLAEQACQVPYGLMRDVLQKVQSTLNRTSHWRVTCPLGTDISGESDPQVYATQPKAGFTVQLFPLGPFRTFSCETARGRLVTRWLPPSATHRYEPYGIVLDDPITLLVEHGRIVDFQGDGDSVATARGHYERVAKTLGIDPYVVHSWHGGVNPKIFYPQPAANNVERWNGVMHSHPRYAHFHSCGAYNPGEIIIPIIDPSIRCNDETLWDQGRLLLLEGEDILALLAKYPDAENPFVMRMDIGI